MDNWYIFKKNTCTNAESILEFEGIKNFSVFA